MDLATQERSLRIVHLALCLTLVIYGVVAFTAAAAGPPSELPPAFLYALLAVAGSTLPIIIVIRQKLLPPMAPPASMRDLPDQKLDDKEQAAIQRYFSASIVSWALSESIAIYGLILSFISHVPTWYPGFGAVALALMLLFRPKREELEGVMRAATRP